MKRNLIRIVHTVKSRLGWDDETYRGVLAQLTGQQVVTYYAHRGLYAFCVVWPPSARAVVP